MAAIRSGIPTTLESSNFRSRLEARWAAFFDLIGWQWIYEPIDTEGYIPDFLIQGKHPLFVEVGPCITIEDYFTKSQKAGQRAHLLGHDVLVVGVSPISPLPTSHWTYSTPGCTAGLLGEFCDSRHFDSHDTDCTDREPCDHVYYAWGSAVWADPSGLQVFHDKMSYERRPFGGGDGSHPNSAVDPSVVDRLWRKAGNAVQWRAAG